MRCLADSADALSVLPAFAGQQQTQHRDSPLGVDQRLSGAPEFLDKRRRQLDRFPLRLALFATVFSPPPGGIGSQRKVVIERRHGRRQRCFQLPRRFAAARTPPLVLCIVHPLRLLVLRPLVEESLAAQVTSEN